MAIKKEVKKAVKKEVKTKVWGKATDKALSDMKVMAKKNKNVLIFVHTEKSVEGGTNVQAALHSAGVNLPNAVATILMGIDKKAPGAVEAGILKFLTNK